MRKLLAMILSVLLACSCLTGCGPKKPEQTQAQTQTETESETAAQKPGSYAFALELRPLELEKPVDTIISFAGQEERVYFAAATVEDERMESHVFRLDLETGKPSQVALPPMPDADNDIVALSMGQDGSLWVLRRISTYTWDLPEGMTKDDPAALEYRMLEKQELRLCHLDQQDKFLEEHPLDLSAENRGRQLVMDGQNRFYFSDYQNVYVLDSQGKEVKHFPIEGAPDLIQLGKDAVGVRLFSETERKPKLYVLDTEAGALGKELPMPRTVWRFYPGMDGYDFLYLDGQDVYGAFLDEGREPERLFSWLDCNVNPDTFRDFIFQSDGTIVGLERSGKDWSLVTLTPADPDTRTEKRELTLACVGLDFNFKPMIVAFNRTHPDMQIVVRDYSESDETGRDAGFTRLATEMMAGSLPDILLTRGMPVEQLAGAGLLVDLWPFLEREVGRDKLMDHVLDAMSIDGKLPYLTDGFAIHTATCDKKYTGDRRTWTMAEMLEVLDSLPPETDVFRKGITKENALYTILGMELPGLVDWKTATCSFDGPQFAQMLRFADRFPLEFDRENDRLPVEREDDLVRMREGKQLMHDCWLESLGGFMQELALYEDGQAAFVGYPTQTGSGSVFLPNGGLAMTTACADQEAAWDLISMLLTEERQNVAGFPISRELFEEDVEQWMTPEYTQDPETGEQVEAEKDRCFYGDNAPIYAMTKEQYDLFLEVYETCQTINSCNEDISQLVMDEAAAYFAGQKTAEETARLIQNRVGLYLREQAA